MAEEGQGLPGSSYMVEVYSFKLKTFQGNIEIGSHKTGGRLIQVQLIWNAL